MPPLPAQATLEQALAHHRANRLAQARLGYRQVRQQSPRAFEGYYLGGLVELQAGHPREALPLLQQASRIHPRHALTFHCLGNALLSLGQRDEAGRAIETSLKLDPNNAEAWGNLGALHTQAGRFREAVDAYEKGLGLDRQNASLWSDLGAALLLQGQAARALEAQLQALQLDPRHPRAGRARGQCLFQLCDLAGARDAFDAHLRLFPDDLEARSQRLLLLHYGEDLSPEQLAAEHRDYGQRAHRRFGAATAFPPPGERLRVLFLSPDLRQHSVAYFLEPLLQHLDRNLFEIVLYHDYVGEDAVTARLKAHASTFRKTVGLDDATVASFAREDRIDIALDLAGHTGCNRMSLFARRIAPLQATYLGYPNTTGLPSMDIRLVDEFSDPPGIDDSLYTETRVRFSSCAWCYAPPLDAPEPTWGGSENGTVTFGSFNNATKLSDACLTAWADLLRADVRFHLVLKSSGLRPEIFRQRLERHGFPLDRVTLLSATPSTREHLEWYRKIDLALDPFPYHGTTTTCEALFMGVPVVSLAGRRHASRVGASLLHAVGHAEWCASDLGAYLSLAQNLARDVDHWRARRAELRAALLRSRLTDAPAQAEAFGAALHEAYLAKTTAIVRQP